MSKIRVERLGHVVLRVRDLERSLAFYRDALGLQERARYRSVMAFLSCTPESHHDLALMAVGLQARNPSPQDVGLYHIAFKIGDDLETLRQAKQELERRGIAIAGMSDHGVSKSLYLHDPDGNEVELYVDADPALWRDNPQLVATVKPLAL